MNNLPEFVRWACEDIIKDAKEEMIPRMDEWRKDNFDLMSNFSFDEIRSLATVISEIGFDEVLYNQIDYKEQRKIKERLNDVFDQMLGELVFAYDLFDKKFNKEKWNGDERYKLLALHNRKGYSEMSVLKNVVWYSQLFGKTITKETTKELERLFTDTLYWEFGHEYREHDWDVDENHFRIANECRKREIEAQNQFVSYVLHQEYDKAYDMIRNQIEKIKSYIN